MFKWTKVLFLLMSLVLVQSCVKDLQDIDQVEVENWQPEVATALVNTTVSIQDLLDNSDADGYLRIDEDNFMTLVYQSEVFSVAGAEVVTMPNFTIPMFDTSMVIPYGMIDTPFDIDFFSIKSGTLDFTFDSPYAEDMEVMIEVRNLTQNGTKLQFTKSAEFLGSSPTNVSGSMDLSGYIMDFVNDEIEVRYVATNAMGERKYLQNAELTFHDFEYNFAQGYFAQHEFDLPSDSIIIGLFDDAVGGSVYLEDPKIKLVIHNSFGIPIQLTTENLEAETADNQTLNVQTVLNQGVLFNYPTAFEVGQSMVTNIEINADNSNLSEILASNPQKLNYKLNAISNPDDDASIKGFVMDTSRFDVDVEVELPIYLSASNFAIEKVNDFDASIFEDLESAEFKLITENGLPVEAGVQVYFLDENSMVLDSLFDNVNATLIPAALVDSEGKVTTFSKGEDHIEIGGERLENFSNATQISIKGLVSTAEAGAVAVRFYTDYEMNFKLGVIAKLKK